MVRLHLLGGFALTGTDGPPLPTRKAEALLAYLALSEDRSVRRDKLAALFWGGRGEAQARHSLTQSLYVIRRSLGDSARDALHSDSRTVTLDLSGIMTDAALFHEAALGMSEHSLETAASLYRGALLDGFHIASEPFVDWLDGKRREFHAAAIGVLQRLMEHQIERGGPKAAIATSEQLLAMDPLQESVHRDLMRQYVRAGHTSAAIRQYQSCAALLQRELNVDPDPATKALLNELLSDRTATATSGAAGADLDFRTVPANHTPKLRWIQFPYATRDWASSQPAPGENGRWSRTLETLGAFVVKTSAVLNAANTDYTRVVVAPPSQTWPNCSAVPGRVAHPGLL